jgi:hypothetical protein
MARESSVRHLPSTPRIRFKIAQCECNCGSPTRVDGSVERDERCRNWAITNPSLSILRTPAITGAGVTSRLIEVGQPGRDGGLVGVENDLAHAVVTG